MRLPTQRLVINSERRMLGIHYNQVDSTSDRAWRLARLNRGRPLLVWADAQTSGRGRTGRSWQSPRGGAWFSIAWPLNGLHQDMEAAPLVVGLAVCDTIGQLLSAKQAQTLSIKWPNDVLLNGKKIAGILCEQMIRPDQKDRTIIIGVGINANVQVSQLGHDLRHPAVSLLQAIGQQIDVEKLIRDCAHSIQIQIERLQQCGLCPDTAQRVNHRLAWVGKPITLNRGEQAVAGTMCGIDSTGRLLLRLTDGVQAFCSGEVQMLTAANEIGETSRSPTCSILAH